jgi:hypothetical protein
MFMPRRPDKKKAAAELRQSAILFGTLVVTVRVAPYLLHLFQKAF